MACRFYNAVDIYVPRTHGDPEHYIDPLPQPYRRIMKVGGAGRVRPLC